MSTTDYVTEDTIEKYTTSAWHNVVKTTKTGIGPERVPPRETERGNILYTYNII